MAAIAVSWRIRCVLLDGLACPSDRRGDADTYYRCARLF